MTDLQALLFGGVPFERESAPEPSLLPHLARMAHPEDHEELWAQAEQFGLQGGVAPPWPPLWECVRAVVPPPGDDPPWPTFEFSILAWQLPRQRGGVRRATADRLADDIAQFDRAPWFVALAVSRIAPFASDGRTWPTVGDPLWDGLIERLASAGWPDELFGDVLRAHPYAEELCAVEGLHETSGAALREIPSRWIGATSAALPPDGPEPPPPPPPIPMTGMSPIPMSAHPDTSEAAPDVDTGGDGNGARRPASGPPPAARRLQADVLVEGRELTHAFVAGARHAVDVSVGHQGRIRAEGDFPTVAMPEDVDRVKLTVRFASGGKVQEGSIMLPRDEERDSTVAGFELEVPAGARQVSATVVVYRDHDVLQGAVLSGPVAADRAAEASFDGEIRLEVGAFVKDLLAPAPSSATSSIVADANGAVASSSTGAVAIDISALRDEVADLAERIDSGAGLLFQGDEAEIERLFRDLALHGRRLRAVVAEQLGPALSSSPRLQIVTLSAGAFLPLELVYDGPQPTPKSKLCENWRMAAAEGSCTACAPSASKAHPLVCPSHFWALSKIIERHAGLGGAAGAFHVRSERSATAGTLRPLVGAVVGASEKVDATDVAAVVKAARKTFQRARKATTWRTWISLVAKADPAVLVAMPHHEEDAAVDPAISSLEIGRALLPAGGLGLTHVGDLRPGPVVLLLGCNTALDSTPIDTFAGEFRAVGASVVVATLGPVIPQDAAKAAETVVTALGAAAVAAGSATFGEVMLRVRRDLVSQGLVLGLLLVANGDADWVLSEVDT